MSHCERIAFAMFKSDYPPHIASEMRLDRMPVLQADMGDGIVGEKNVALDWAFNRETYMRLAAAAVLEFNAIVEEGRKG